MKRRGSIAGAVGLMLVFVILPAGARAATADGTIITNTVSATYSTTFTPGPGSGYSVSYSATARVVAQDPCIDIKKYAEPPGQVVGEIATFRIWVINCSVSASAFNITVYDKLPLDTYYAQGYMSYPSAEWTNAYNLDGGTIYIDGEMNAGLVTGLESVRYYLPRLGINKSAWVSYQVTIQ